MKTNLIRTCDGNIINLDNVFIIEYEEEYGATYAYPNNGGFSVKIADGDVRLLLWNGRRDFTEVNYGA